MTNYTNHMIIMYVTHVKKQASSFLIMLCECQVWLTRYLLQKSMCVKIVFRDSAHTRRNHPCPLSARSQLARLTLSLFSPRAPPPNSDVITSFPIFIKFSPLWDHFYLYALWCCVGFYYASEAYNLMYSVWNFSRSLVLYSVHLVYRFKLSLNTYVIMDIITR